MYPLSQEPRPAWVPWLLSRGDGVEDGEGFWGRSLRSLFQGEFLKAHARWCEPREPAPASTGLGAGTPSSQPAQQRPLLAPG